MTQKAQLKKYKEKCNHEEGPSTPVVITGGGSTEEDAAVAGVSQQVNIYSELPFKMAAPGDTWVASQSQLPGQIMDVLIAGHSATGLTHPAVLTFRDEADRLLLMMSEAPEGPNNSGSQLTITVFDGAFDVVKPGELPGTWLGSSIISQAAYAKLLVGSDLYTLSPAISVEVRFTPAVGI